MLKIHLLGSLAIEKDGQSLPLPPSAQARDLLAYLTLFRNRKHPRSSLVGTFWPEFTEERARRALSQAIWHIRRCFPEVLSAEAETVRFSPDAKVWVDVDAFEQVIRPWLVISSLPAEGTAALIEAVTIYRGDLLEGNYADWALLERERLRGQYQQALEQLVLAEKKAGHFPQALNYGLRLLQSDPLREGTHREVMRLQNLLGHPEAALRQFESCQRALREELDLEPEEETVTLFQEIARRSGSQTLPFLPEKLPEKRPASLFSVPLVGRKGERVELLTALEAALQGLGGIVLVEGEAGSGKTRLLEEIARDAEWRGAQVLWGRTQNPEAGQPFGLLVGSVEGGLSLLRAEQLHQLVEQVWLQSLCQLIPALSTFLPSLKPAARLAIKQEHPRLTEAFARLFEGWRKILPVVILLEDLHRADPDTLKLLPWLGSRLKETGLLLVCSFRSEEAHSTSLLLESLQNLGQIAQRLHLGPLDDEASGELIRRSLTLAQPAPLFEKRILAKTEGNPLFILETLRTLCDGELLYQDSQGQWHTPWDESTSDYAELPLAPGIERVISQRLEQLPSTAWEVLQLAAVLGSQVDYPLLNTVSGLPATELLARVQILIRRFLLEETGGGYRFSHEMVRQVAYKNLETVKCRSLHQQAAEIIELSHPAQVEILAYHFEKAALWNKAINYHLRAAQEAYKFQAYQQAAIHCNQVLSIVEEQLPFAKEKASQEHALKTRFEALSIRQQLSWMAGQVEAERADLEAMNGLASQLGDPQLQVAAMNRQALFLTETLDDYAGGGTTAEKALTLSRENRDQRGEATARDILGRVAYATDCYEDAVTNFRAAISVWQALDETGELPQTHIRLGRTYKLMGQLDLACSNFATALEAAQKSGNRVDEMYAFSNLAILARVQGDYPSAIQYNQQTLHVAREIGHRPIQATALDNLGVAFWSLRDYGQALEAMRESLELVRRLGDRRGTVFCLNNLGDMSREIGAYQQAEHYLNEGLTLACEIGFAFAEGCFLQGLGRLSLEQKELNEAQTCFEQALKIGRERENLSLVGNAFCGLGLAAIQSGRLEQARGHFEQALQAHLEAGEADYATLDRSHLAFCLFESGDTTQAGLLSRQAITELEAHPGGEEVQQIYFNHWRILQTSQEAKAARRALHQAYQRVQSQANSLTDLALRTAFLENVELNRQICAAWDTTLIQRTSLQLPRRGCPGDVVQVVWTVSAPDDDEISDKVTRRQSRLKRLLYEAREQGADPSYKHLAEALGVGLRTIERDMSEL